MLIEFDYIIKKYGKPKGIIHIGAHLLEERDSYLKHGIKNIVWIEANPFIYEQIINRTEKNNNEVFLNYTVSDTDDTKVDFHITNNGQSSSILELDMHKIYHPSIYVTKTIQTNTKRLDSIFAIENLDMLSYDFINIDIQGAELLAIKGFGNLIDNIKYIYTEVNKQMLYKNCAQISEIDNYLQKFNRTETSWTYANWGDALYVRY